MCVRRTTVRREMPNVSGMITSLFCYVNISIFLGSSTLYRVLTVSRLVPVLLVPALFLVPFTLRVKEGQSEGLHARLG